MQPKRFFVEGKKKSAEVIKETQSIQIKLLKDQVAILEASTSAIDRKVESIEQKQKEGYSDVSSLKEQLHAQSEGLYIIFIMKGQNSF